MMALLVGLVLALVALTLLALGATGATLREVRQLRAEVAQLAPPPMPHDADANAATVALAREFVAGIAMDRIARRRPAGNA